MMMVVAVVHGGLVCFVLVLLFLLLLLLSFDLNDFDCCVVDDARQTLPLLYHC